MTPENSALVKHRLGKAKETLKEARALFDDGFTTGVVNREYYACFYAVSALLLTESLASAKHSGVKSLFNQHWVKTGKIAAEVAAIYNRLFERRQLGDYMDGTTFDRQDVRTWLGEAEHFVDHIADWIAKNAGLRE